MPIPGEKPADKPSSTSPGQTSPQEGLKDMGLEGIDDPAVRKQVEDYLKSRPDLVADIRHENKKAREVLAEKIKEINRTRMQANEIIDGIVQMLRKDTLERDLKDGYQDKNGQPHPGYIEFFHKEVDRVGVDFEGTDTDRNNPVRQACLNIVVNEIKKIDLTVKREIRHQFVEDMIKAYVLEMDKNAETLGVGTLQTADLTKFKPKAFQDWAREPGRPPEADLYLKYDPEKAREFVESTAKTKDTLAKILTAAATLPAELQDYFKNGSKEVESTMADNATGAGKVAEMLLAEANAAAGIAALDAEIQTKKGESSDATIQKRYTDLSAKIDANLKLAAAEKDSVKRKTLLDLSALQAEKAQIDSAVAAPASTPAATPAGTTAPGGAPAATGGTETPGAAPTGTASPPAAQTAPEPEFSITNIGPWLNYQVNSLKKSLTDTMSFLKGLPAMIGGLLGIFGVKSALGKTDVKEKVPTDPKLQKARKFLMDKFGLPDQEVDKTYQLKVKEYLALNTAPAWMDKSRFENLKKALDFNKKDSDNLDVSVWNFVADKMADWKELQPLSTAPTPASTAPTQAKSGNPPAEGAPK